MSEELLRAADQLFRAHHYARAHDLLLGLIDRGQRSSKAFELLGYIASNSGDLTKGFKYLQEACGYTDCSAEALYYLGAHYLRRGSFNEAKSCFEKSMQKAGPYFEALHDLATALSHLGDYEAAYANYLKAKNLNPNSSELFFNLARLEEARKNPNEALSNYSRAIELKPTLSQAHYNCGNVLKDLKDYKKAIAHYDRAIELKPDYFEAWNNRSSILQNYFKHFEEALVSCQRAIELKPDYAEAWRNRGIILERVKRYKEALASYERAFELEPDKDFVLGSLIHTQMKICDWTDFDSRSALLKKGIEAGHKCSNPFPILGLFDSPELQRSAAEIYVNAEYQASDQLGPIIKRSKNDKIRIGYFSMDFCEHPVAYLTADLFKLHDRNQFEIYAFSLGVNNQDAMRQRLEQSFDKFLDVEHLNDSDITRLSRELALDIAIDLGGHTKDSRPRIFSERAAPIQVNYLGYPGTWGSSCMDYFIGDKTTITHENRDYFSEKIIFLPNTYQANPSRRPSLSKKPLRTNYGLPDKSFVFCCFNNNWKVSPAIFVQWMQILKQVPDSVLWLYADNPPSIENMRLEAARNGISAERFVFAERAPLDEYLARFAIADLFLDTLPYNAGTTASDALWAGLPVLTCAGASFAGRMAGSLLKTIGLPDLVTATQNEYERKAIELATDREKLSEIKKRLEDGRRNSPLFDGKRFTKNLEAAYRAIYERHHADLQPDHIYVES